MICAHDELHVADDVHYTTEGSRLIGQMVGTFLTALIGVNTKVKM